MHRCTFTNEFSNLFQLLIEFDLQDWQKRDWLNVYKDNSHLLLIEENLVLAPRTVEPFSKDGILHPALVSPIMLIKLCEVIFDKILCQNILATSRPKTHFYCSILFSDIQTLG